MVRKWIAALVLAVLANVGWAADAPTVAEDPVLEKRVMRLAEELRCLVCQNQTIADSHAELAVDLKNQIRDMLKKGMSDKEIKDYMVARYGDFVLYNPPVKTTTWMLWFGPFLLLGGGLAFGLYKLRQRSRKVAEAALSDAEHARAVELLGDNRSSRGNS